AGAPEPEQGGRCVPAGGPEPRPPRRAERQHLLQGRWIGRAGGLEPRGGRQLAAGRGVLVAIPRRGRWTAARSGPPGRSCRGGVRFGLLCGPSGPATHPRRASNPSTAIRTAAARPALGLPRARLASALGDLGRGRWFG